MSNSNLVSYTKISPNKTSPRNHAIDRITIHCVVGQCTVETLGNIFAPTSKQASSNYGIGKDGRVGMYVEEKDRSWCSSSSANDNRAVTIEVASDTTHPYKVTDQAYSGLLDLVTDICKRNGKTKILWFGDKDKTLAYTPKANEMVMTVHRWFANKSCPGTYLYERHAQIASEVNKRLGSTNIKPEPEKPSGSLYRVQTGAFKVKANADAMLAKVKAKGFDTYMVKVGDLYKIQVGAFKVKANAEATLKKLQAAGFSGFITTEQGSAVGTGNSATGGAGGAVTPYLVRVTISDLYIRKGPGTNYGKNGFIKPGVYTIVAESTGTGATKWGKLKSGAGWISLDYAKKA